MIWLLSGTALVSILISALCAASETATFAIGTSRLRTMEEEGFRGADALADVRGRAEQTRATLLFLNTLFNAVTVGTCAPACPSSAGSRSRARSARGSRMRVPVRSRS